MSGLISLLIWFGAPILISIISKFLNEDEKVDLNGNKNQNSSKQRFSSGDFKVSFLILVAAQMKLDGRVTKAELGEVKVFLVQHFTEEEALKMLQLLKEILNHNYDYQSVTVEMGRRMSYSSKLELMHLLFKIAKVDDEKINTQSFNFLTQVATFLLISQADFNSLKSIYYYTYYQYDNTYNNRSSYTTHSFSNDDWAYEVLEISKEASEAEIKKAYRRMAMKYHPDKLVGMGEDIKRAGEEKFRVVNKAYEALKKSKGFV